MWFRAVRVYIPLLGVTVTIKKKKGKPSKLAINFTRQGTIKFHLTQIGLDINKYFKRKRSDCQANIFILEDHPVTFIFNCQTNTLMTKAKHELHNRYGMVCNQ